MLAACFGNAMRLRVTLQLKGRPLTNDAVVAVHILLRAATSLAHESIFWGGEQQVRGLDRGQDLEGTWQPAESQQSAHLCDHGLSRSANSHAGPGREQEHEAGSQQATNEHFRNGNIHLQAVQKASCSSWRTAAG